MLENPSKGKGESLSLGILHPPSKTIFPFVGPFPCLQDELKLLSAQPPADLDSPS